MYDRLQRSDDVIEVPPDEAHGTRRRLVVSIRQGSEAYDASRPGLASRPALFGTIWVQEGAQPLAADSAAVLRGASAVAARLITRTLNAPSNEAVQIQRLLGARGGGVDIGSLAAALALPSTGPAVVIGLSPVEAVAPAVLADLSSAVRLHASAYARESLVTTIGDRIYVLVPRTRSPATLGGLDRQGHRTDRRRPQWNRSARRSGGSGEQPVRCGGRPGRGRPRARRPDARPAGDHPGRLAYAGVVGRDHRPGRRAPGAAGSPPGTPAGLRRQVRVSDAGERGGLSALLR